MLLDLGEIAHKYKLDVSGILHIGAHLAEEADEYHRLFPAVPVWWVEANPAVKDRINRRLMAFPHQTLIEGLVTDMDGETRTFHRSNYLGMSSSVLPFGTHPTFSPDTVFVDDLELPTVTIDTLAARHGIAANMLVMDIQGAELLALRGGQEFLFGVDYLYCEVNQAEVYVGCAKVHELDEFVKPYRLRRVETSWVPGQGWGDGCWVRRP